MSNNRISKWDNLKALMMLSVVLGHTIYFFMNKDSEVLKGIYIFIYTFHMPVFIFLTGLFSKRAIYEKKYERVIEYLFVYLSMKFLDYFSYVMHCKVSREDLFTLQFFTDIKDGLSSPYKGFHLFWEDGPGWYALAIAVFLLITMFIQEYDMGVMFAVSIVVGCLAGLDNHLGNHFASMRICTFYPVFLLGFYTDRRYLDRSDLHIVGKIACKIASVIVLILTLLISLLNAESIYPYINLLKGKTNYIELGLGAYGILWRCLLYILWFVLIFAMIQICPAKNHIWSWFGERTMSIFIWHKFVLVCVLQMFFAKYYLQHYIPHYYGIAAVCVGMIVFIITAYFPGFRISKYFKKEES